MDLDAFRWLLTDDGQALLARAEELDPADPLRAQTALRRHAGAEHAAAAVAPSTVSRRGRAAAFARRVRPRGRAGLAAGVAAAVLVGAGAGFAVGHAVGDDGRGHGIGRGSERGAEHGRPDGDLRGGPGGPQGRPGLPPAYVSPDPESSASPDSSAGETQS